MATKIPVFSFKADDVPDGVDVTIKSETVKKLNQGIDTLTAENAKLREVLESIAPLLANTDYCPTNIHLPDGDCDAYSEANPDGEPCEDCWRDVFNGLSQPTSDALEANDAAKGPSA